MMKKAFAVILTIAILMAALPLTASAQFAGYDDVSQNDWYSEYVGITTEFGLLKGVSENSFDPNGTLTVAQGIAIVARLVKFGDQFSMEFTQGSPWYKVYVDYLYEEGIAAVALFTDYSKPISRAIFAYLLGAYDDMGLTPDVNEVTSIKDVPSTSPYFDAVKGLYVKGICIGDSENKFNPYNSITRAEAAAIISRILVPSMRLKLDGSPVVQSPSPVPEPEPTPTPAAEPARSIFELIKDGVLSVSAEADSIDTASLVVTNKTDKAVAFFIPAGAYVKCASTSYQNLLITEYVEDTVSALGNESIYVDAACMNIARDIPDGSSGFALTESSNSKLEKLVEYFEENYVEYPIRQAAVWIITDSASYSDCQILVTERYSGELLLGNFSIISQEDYNTAKEIVNGL